VPANRALDQFGIPAEQFHTKITGWSWIYLATVLDDFSRYVAGELAEYIEAQIKAFVEHYNRQRYHQSLKGDARRGLLQEGLQPSSRSAKGVEHNPIRMNRIMLYYLLFSAFSEPEDDAICLENAPGDRPSNIGACNTANP